MAKKKNKPAKKTNGLNQLPSLDLKNLTKKQKNALVGVGVAAAAAGAYYLTKGKIDWSFLNELTGKISGSQTSGSTASSGADAPVDVALTNDVAKSTQHNPNNASDFTDDGATGNAD